MKKLVFALTCFFLAVNVVAGAAFVYHWSRGAIHDWHMAYYDKIGLPQTRTVYISEKGKIKNLKPVFRVYS